MNNVNDLHRTSNNAPVGEQPISLSALNENEENTVTINATNGLSGVAESNETNRPVIRINPRKTFERRTITDPSQVIEVNPDDYLPPKQKVVSETPRDRAIGLLDDAVKRKKQEYHDFVEQAKAEDEINRENIEAGIEDAVDTEMHYVPAEVEQHEEKAKIQKEVEKKKKANIEEEDEDFFDGIDEFVAPEQPVATNVTINNPFEDDEEETFDHTEKEEITLEPEEDDIPAEEDKQEENIVESKDSSDDHNEISYDEEKEFMDTNNEKENDKVEDVNMDTKTNKFDIGSNAIPVVSNALETANTTSSDFDIDDEDFDDVTIDTEENLTDEQIINISEESEKHLRSEILEKVVRGGKKINASQLVVSNKVINVKEALRNTKTEVARTASWPLTFAGRPYMASALRGPEIALMSDSDTSGDDGVGLSMTQAQIMFEHDANPYRPSTLEAWSKTIPFADVENIFAALYCASMNGANYIPMACPKESCQYAYLHDDVPIEKMVKFSTDKSKDRFEKIKHMKLNADNTNSYESVISVINDKFAVGLKLPSIFTIMYEYNSLNPEFVKKYTAMVSIIQYIDFMYLIDEESGSLQPIGWKSYPGDNTKTFKSKIATYAKILKQFDDAEFSVLMALINSMVSKAADTMNITFEIPADKCPKCGAEIEARPINARSLVFMRQRLVELATTPIVK